MTDVNIEAELREINNSGDVFIDFVPGIAEVPEVWTQMWSLEEREKLDEQDRIVYEEQLLEILHVVFL